MKCKIPLILFFIFFAAGLNAQDISNTNFEISGEKTIDLAFTPDAEGKYKITGLGDGWIRYEGNHMEFMIEIPYLEDFVKDSLEYYRKNGIVEVINTNAEEKYDFAKRAYTHSVLKQTGINPKVSDIELYEESFGIVLLGKLFLPDDPYELNVRMIEKDKSENVLSENKYPVVADIISYSLLPNRHYEIIFSLDENSAKNSKCPQKTVFVSTFDIPEEVLPFGLIPQVEISFTGKSKKCSVDFEWNDNLYTLTYKIK